MSSEPSKQRGLGAGLRRKWSSTEAKEWSHFCVLTPGGHFVVNLSTQTDLTGRLLGTVSVLCGGPELATNRSWYGEAGRYFDDQVSVGPELCTWGPSTLHLLADRQVLKLETEQCRAELHFVPRCTPYLAHNVGFARGSRFNWFTQPDCVVDGWFECCGRRVELKAAPGYSDHNWGNFRWGGDFAWEWGFNAPSSHDGLCLVFSRVTDGARLHTLTQGLLVWERGELVRAFRELELTVERQGAWTTRPAVQVPALLGHLVEIADADLPSGLRIAAQGRNAALELCFRARDLAQFVIADEQRAGVCVMNEVFGPLHVRGQIEGRNVEFEAVANFEFFERAPAAEPSREVPVTRAQPDRVAVDRQGLAAELGPCCQLMKQALQCVEREVPSAYTRLCELSWGLDCAITLEGEAPEHVRLLGNLGELRWVPGACSARQIEIQVEKRALAELLQGRLRVSEALRAERLSIRANRQWLVRLTELGVCFLHAVTNCKAAPELLVRLQSELTRNAAQSSAAFQSS